MMVLLLILQGLSLQALVAENWIDKNGRTIDADFIKIDGENLVVLRQGRQVKIPLNLLSDESVELARSMASRKEEGPLEPIVRKVLAINIDPIIESEGRKRLHEVLDWYDPEELNEQYLKYLTEASGGLVKWELVAWEDVDLWPKKTDGFSYDDESYLKMWHNNREVLAHKPDSVDYEYLLDMALSSLDGKSAHEFIVSGGADEVVLWGHPYAGFYESRMVGKTAYWCNAPELIRDSRLYVVMGMNVERDVANALHSFGHRAESIMKKVYGSWSDNSEVNHLWDRFTRVKVQHPDVVSGVGNVHYPPNGKSDYDYSAEEKVESEADLWLSYPDLSAEKPKKVGSNAWGGPNHQLNYMLWWMERIPKALGRYRDPDNEINHGKRNNWWSYIVDMNASEESR